MRGNCILDIYKDKKGKEKGIKRKVGYRQIERDKERMEKGKINERKGYDRTLGRERKKERI
jgi:hypothetical protein